MTFYLMFSLVFFGIVNLLFFQSFFQKMIFEKIGKVLKNGSPTNFLFSFWFGGKKVFDFCVLSEKPFIQCGFFSFLFFSFFFVFLFFVGFLGCGLTSKLKFFFTENWLNNHNSKTLFFGFSNLVERNTQVI